MEGYHVRRGATRLKTWFGKSAKGVKSRDGFPFQRSLIESVQVRVSEEAGSGPPFAVPPGGEMKSRG